MSNMPGSGSAKDTMEGVSRAAGDFGSSVMEGVGSAANAAKDTMTQVGNVSAA